MAAKPRGRPRKYAEYEALLAELPKLMTKRPRYVNGIGVFRGATGDTAWLKLRLPNGGVYKGKRYAPGKSLEVKLGNLPSWSWAQLEAKHKELQGKADRGEPLEDVQVSLFSEWAENWLGRAEKRLKGYDTVRIHVRQHLLPQFGALPLSDIQLQNVNALIAKRLGVAKPATVKRELSTLNAILNDAVRSGLIDANPGRYADTIKGVVGRQRFLSLDELDELLASSEKVADWLPDFILWCVHSGMRKGEIRALQWSNIKTLSDGREFVLVETSKTDQPRTVTCTETMKEILERQRSRKLEGDERVFPVSAMGLRKRWERARKLAKLEDVTIHDLRRTHSTHAVAAGVDLRTLQGRLGHSNLSMLEKHYAALVGSAGEQAAKTIESALTGPGKKAQRAHEEDEGALIRREVRSRAREGADA